MWISKNSLMFSIETNWKSKYLQNKTIKKENSMVFSFWIVYENIVQIYCFDSIITEDLSKIEVINKYRISKKVSLKITIDKNNKKIIWILFWKEIDSWLSWFIWDFDLKITSNDFIFSLSWYIENNHLANIHMKGDIIWKYYQENLPNFYLEPYKINVDKYIEWKVIWSTNKIIKYYSAYLFEPGGNYLQLTLWESVNEKINFFNYRYLNKHVSIVFNLKTKKLIYFFIIIDKKEYFLFKEDLLNNTSIVDYTDGLSWYWKVKLDIEIKLDEPMVQFILQWELPTIKYPNF